MEALVQGLVFIVLILCAFGFFGFLALMSGSPDIANAVIRRIVRLIEGQKGG